MLVKSKSSIHPAFAATLAVFCSLSAPAAAQPAGAPQFGPWGFDLSGRDLTVNPGNSFDVHTNGAWHARTEIPADKVRLGMFDVLREKTQEQLRAIIEDAAKAGSSADANARKIGTLYNAFMDVARLDALDAAPLTDDLARIRDARTKADMARLMGASDRKSVV